MFWYETLQNFKMPLKHKFFKTSTGSFSRLDLSIQANKGPTKPVVTVPLNALEKFVGFHLIVFHTDH